MSNFSGNRVPEDVRILQQRIGLDLLRRIIFRTPVLTGRARGNWQATIGPAGAATVNATDMDGGATLSSGAVKISGAPPYSVITLFNNLKYIRALEEGSSKKAPRGMLKISTAEVNAQFK